jgi:A/G-specific adenine glycosylase
VAPVLEKDFFIKWFKKSGREFPWRREGITPFQFLITEMLLRQTDAPSVAKIWRGFFEKYPDAFALARARKDTLLRRVQILGFGNQRSAAIKGAAIWLVEHHHGQVPNDLEKLLEIPHVGHYAARAVLCFAFGHRIEIVDVNVQRFFSRYYGLVVKPDTRQNKWLWDIAREAVPGRGKRAKQHNFGLLDFTAQICKAGRPLCEICPLNTSCEFGKQRMSASLSAFTELKMREL